MFGLFKKRLKAWSLVFLFIASIFVSLDFARRDENGYAIATLGIGVLYVIIGSILYRKKRI
jgi:hypothetical protein